MLTHAGPLTRLEASYLNIAPFTRPHIVAPGVIIKALPAHRTQCTPRLQTSNSLIPYETKGSFSKRRVLLVGSIYR